MGWIAVVRRLLFFQQRPDTNESLRSKTGAAWPGSSSVVRRLLFQFECFEKLGGEVSADEIFILHQLLVEGNRRLRLRSRIPQGPAHRVDGFLCGFAPPR